MKLQVAVVIDGSKATALNNIDSIEGLILMQIHPISIK
jgi:hypothetical protein